MANIITPPGLYEFESGKRSIFVEIYFPKKVKYQGTIFDALEEGLDETRVKKKLVDNAKSLLESELSVYSHWFNPSRYDATTQLSFSPTIGDAKARMEMYKSPFFGWSMYEVDGVYLSKRKKHGKRVLDEERTQVIRLIFTFSHKEERRARKSGNFDVYRAVLYWVMTMYGHTEYDCFWSDAELSRFLSRHSGWEPKKQAYAKKIYKDVVTAITKWIDDCGLFVFGYLVRELWTNVIDVAQVEKGRKVEDEIWVSSIFDFNINIMKPRAILPTRKDKE